MGVRVQCFGAVGIPDKGQFCLYRDWLCSVTAILCSPLRLTKTLKRDWPSAKDEHTATAEQRNGEHSPCLMFPEQTWVESIIVLDSNPFLCSVDLAWCRSANQEDQKAGFALCESNRFQYSRLSEAITYLNPGLFQKFGEVDSPLFPIWL